MTEEYTLSGWKLDDLFPGFDTMEMETAFADLETRITEFEGWRDKLDKDMDFEEFMDCVEYQEKTTRMAYRIGQFSSLFFAEDTQNQDAQNFQAKMQQFMAGIQNRTLFFSLWWKELDDADADRLMKDAGVFKYFLEQIRNFKPYTLTESEEKIINIKDVTGVSAIRTLYSSITNR